MCGTVNHHDAEDMVLARRLAMLGLQLDEMRHQLNKPESDDALEIVEALYHRSHELAGDCAEDIFGADDEESHL